MIARFLSYVFSLVALGAVVAGGAGAWALWHYGQDLPPTAQLAEYRPPQSSLVYDDDGGVIARFAREERLFVPIDDVPDLVKQAFISAEDKNFYSHDGVDLVGLAKASVRNIKAFMDGDRLSGASTITQQVVKNIVLTNERSFERKIREALIARQIERDLGKDRILELYLNEIYLGSRSYGVGSAARSYFGKRLEYLEPEEAAYLAALPKAPSALHPIDDHDRAIGRRNFVLREMQENGYLTTEQYDIARAKPLETQITAQIRTTESYDWTAAYMIEDVRSRLLEHYENEMRIAGSVEPKVDAEAKLYGGGLRIRTTLDQELQEHAARALRNGLHVYDKRNGYRGPLGTIDPTGEWTEALARAYYPDDLGEWQIGAVLELDLETNEAFIGLRGGDEPIAVTLEAVTWARRQGEDGKLAPKVAAISEVFTPGDVVYVVPGTEAKGGDVLLDPLGQVPDEPVWGLRQLPEANGAVVAMEPKSGRVLAMQGGISAQQSEFNRVTQADRQPGSAFKPIVYAAALANGYTPATIVLDAPVTVDQGNDEGLWRPGNYYDEFYGATPLRIGLEKSRNLMTVRVVQDIGVEAVADLAKVLGIYDDMPPLLSYSLGAGETTLMRVATAYAMLANGGTQISPRVVEALTDADGEPIALPADWMAETLPDEPAQILDPVTAFQTVSLMEGVVLRGTATKLTRLGFPVAGKTGTTNDARDAWFVGFTPELVFGCYIGFDNPKSLGRKASGGAICGPVFEEFMRAAMADRTPRSFEAPDGVEIVKINRFDGSRVAADVFGKDVIWEAFREGSAPELNTDIVDSASGSFFPAPEGSSWTPVDEQTQPVAVATRPAPAPDPRQPGIEQPLISFDPLTGEMIVAQDSAIRVVNADGS